jgi:hypothetical protein
MTALFMLYLVLVEKPRFDESNVLATGLTMEQCGELTGMLNAEHHAMNPDQSPRYLWACGPMPFVEPAEPLIDA